ncbi:FtsK/SpoIIIE domain-containing protein [Kineococcus radiotolerans]|uniref:Cell divisionFtsK/SpoIIIE n=1 Tax=Kineococcus radiotolerans (strain ATCC BAA-149 / DSM 14245 / SRS30216) TaxID=266940 RepID=A6WCP8_KINRD|nr:FtsK/SpoIIIE domain-containing protein [Kineococcus radiotolerans]ABS04587.1 cell divisionFtsK/SpoIIIE [Kineococcus radiotolerans SRS30216 = ATCC BAA-149]
MRLAVTVVDPRAGSRRDLVVEADPRTPFGDLAPVLGTSGARVFHDGAELAPDVLLGDSGVREGAVLSLHDASGCVPAEPGGSVELRVVGGTGAGAVHRLGVGEHLVGPAGTVPVHGPATVRVAVAPTGAVLVSAAGGEPRLETVELRAAQLWSAGDLVDLGATLLGIGVPTAPDAVLEPAAASAEEVAGFDYNRPPRLLPPDRTTRFRLPHPPGDPARRPFPVVAALAPLAMSATMVAVSHHYAYLAIGLLTPVVVVANALVDRRAGRTSHRAVLARYRREKLTTEDDAARALVAERRARRDSAPDPAELLLTAIGPRARLWERRRRDADHLHVRVGLADLPSDVVVEDPEQLEHRRLVTATASRVPVTVPLAEHPVTGVAGAGARALAARWLVQLAVLQSPRDVSLHVLTSAAGLAEWEWVRWVPHARAEAGGAASVFVGTTTETWARRVAELGAALEDRRRALADLPAGARLDVPDLVVVLDGARRLRSLPGVVTLLTDGPALGVRVVCCEEDRRSLPEECSAVVEERPDGSLRVERQRHPVVAGVLPDLPAPGWAARIARALAPVRDAGNDDAGAGLPDGSRLLDVLGLEPPTPQAVSARWLLSPASTTAVVGESLDGPFGIDLRADGPHGLVAGTTGSGKSELLQTIVASLAVANRPDAMTFVLVDYKGGAAFKDCVDLPHTVGMVTDLDTHLVARALTSLGAELHHREQLLAAAGAKDLEDHDDLREADPGRGLPRIPRLLIVIDEFASLARELPDFVTGLVNIAQRGRSLGIHLLLATQRPTGVVSAEIRANTNLRIALRVTDAAESSDVLDAPDAARIAKATPGRAYVKLGHGSLVPFQSGRVGGRRPGVSSAQDVPAPWSAPLPPADLGRPAPRRPRGPAARDDAAETDLRHLVAAVRAAAEDLGVPAPRSPWLPALPALLSAADLPAPTGTNAATYGTVDVPERQRRDGLEFDLDVHGHLYVVGAPRSGRSQLLRTLAARLAERVPTADLHLYGLDCGGGALLALAALPHTGAVVQRSETDRAVRLLTRLREEVLRRQGELGALGVADVGEQRALAAAGGPPAWPHLVLLLDRWEGFLGGLAELDGQAPLELVTTLLREGAGVGVHVVVAGDRQLLTGRTGTLVEDKLLLRLTDRADAVLAGLSARQVPEDVQPGRLLRAGTGAEAQVAVLGDDPSGPAQVAALAALAERLRTRDAGTPRERRPFRLDVLPTSLDYDRALELTERGPGRLVALVGVGGDDLTGLGPDLLAGPGTAIVAGPARSGRSTVLLTMARSLLDQGAQVVIAAPRPSPLRALAGRPGVRAVLTGDDLTAAELEPLLGAAAGPAVLLVDDAEVLRNCAADGWLSGLVARCGRDGTAVIVAGEASEVGSGFSNWQVPLRRNRCGVLIAPGDVMAGDVVGARVPRSALGAPAQPGRVLLHTGDGELRTVAVPQSVA